MREKALIIFVVLLMLLTISCGSNEPIKEKKREIRKEENSGIPYTIINEKTLSNIKTMIDIRLESELNEADIKKIAHELKSQGRDKYQRIFINYWLPDMEVGSGAWAISHFNPNLEVEILGLAKEEKARLVEETADTSGNLMGRWIDNSPYVSGVYSIFKEGECT